MWRRNADAELTPMYDLASAVAVLEHTPTHQTTELLEWMGETLPEILDDEVLAGAVPLEPHTAAFTVAHAAEILDRDPTVSIGRQSLFAHLEHIGWAERHPDGHWQPTATARRHHWLTIRAVVIRAGNSRRYYDQLYITQTGLTELRRTLHALHSEPVLFEPETLPIPDTEG
ncbi:phage antirepressor KilAC domain-containing protein [Microbacterium sp. NIBRBAC000506063]|uniref:phage antirepressor KilAC domain-containing protein n=1 Tax=Microbacterium sp. NIBRBAC000506063 TaxID=2734618 RepID=UPI001CB74CC8|nr:phage antirepressor KilAC domain-containing protein [Microbacterium sp. NIBRBAC000506063]